MRAEEVWNGVLVYGPQSEIERLIKLCHLWTNQVPTDKAVADFGELMMPGSSWSCEYFTWNGVTHGPHKPGEFSFCFDSDGGAPEDIFKRLAEEFPTLEFRCSSIGSQDEFMAEGTFHGASGRQGFTYQRVPADYWGRGSEPEEEDTDVN